MQAVIRRILGSESNVQNVSFAGCHADDCPVQSNGSNFDRFGYDHVLIGVMQIGRSAHVYDRNVLCVAAALNDHFLRSAEMTVVARGIEPAATATDSVKTLCGNFTAVESDRVAITAKVVIRTAATDTCGIFATDSGHVAAVDGNGTGSGSIRVVRAATTDTCASFAAVGSNFTTVDNNGAVGFKRVTTDTGLFRSCVLREQLPHNGFIDRMSVNGQSAAGRNVYTAVDGQTCAVRKDKTYVARYGNTTADGHVPFGYVPSGPIACTHCTGIRRNGRIDRTGSFVESPRIIR